MTEPVTPAALPALSQPELDFSPSHTEARVAHPSTGIAECSTPRTSPRPLRPETPGTSLGDSRDPSRPPAAAVAVGPAAMREWWGECCRQAASLPLLHGSGAADTIHGDLRQEPNAGGSSPHGSPRAGEAAVSEPDDASVFSDNSVRLAFVNAVEAGKRAEPASEATQTHLPWQSELEEPVPRQCVRETEIAFEARVERWKRRARHAVMPGRYCRPAGATAEASVQTSVAHSPVATSHGEDLVDARTQTSDASDSSDTLKVPLEDRALYLQGLLSDYKSRDVEALIRRMSPCITGVRVHMKTVPGTPRTRSCRGALLTTWSAADASELMLSLDEIQLDSYFTRTRRTQPCQALSVGQAQFRDHLVSVRELHNKEIGALSDRHASEIAQLHAERDEALRKLKCAKSENEILKRQLSTSEADLAGAQALAVMPHSPPGLAAPAACPTGTTPPSSRGGTSMSSQDVATPRPSDPGNGTLALSSRLAGAASGLGSGGATATSKAVARPVTAREPRFVEKPSVAEASLSPNALPEEELAFSMRGSVAHDKHLNGRREVVSHGTAELRIFWNRSTNICRCAFVKMTLSSGDSALRKLEYGEVALCFQLVSGRTEEPVDLTFSEAGWGQPARWLFKRRIDGKLEEHKFVPQGELGRLQYALEHAIVTSVEHPLSTRKKVGESVFINDFRVEGGRATVQRVLDNGDYEVEFVSSQRLRVVQHDKVESRTTHTSSVFGSPWSASSGEPSLFGSATLGSPNGSVLGSPVTLFGTATGSAHRSALFGSATPKLFGSSGAFGTPVSAVPASPGLFGSPAGNAPRVPASWGGHAGACAPEVSSATPPQSPRTGSAGHVSSLLVLTEESRQFLSRNPVDSRAEKRLGDMSDDLQARVCEFDLKPDVRNPSAYLSKRCKEVEKDAARAQAESSHMHTDEAEKIEFTDGDALEEPTILVAPEDYAEVCQHFGLSHGEVADGEQQGSQGDFEGRDAAAAVDHCEPNGYTEEGEHNAYEEEYGDDNWDEWQ